MSTFDDLLAHAQRLLDQRQDPFDDAVFCKRLMECPEAMEEVVRLRAALLCVESAEFMGKNRRFMWWVASIAATVLIFSFIPTKGFKPDALPHSIAKASLSTSPAVISFRRTRNSTELNPTPASAHFRVSVTSSQVSTKFHR